MSNLASNLGLLACIGLVFVASMLLNLLINMMIGGDDDGFNNF